MSVPPVTIVPLVPNLPLPQQATARTRSSIPPGYGFKSSACLSLPPLLLGFLIGLSVRFGLR